MAYNFEYKGSELDQNVTDMFNKMQAKLMMYSVTKASQLQAYMQTHRPWTDRTGEAKRRLRASVSQPDETTIRITLSHGVDYGIWLELANEKKYAIVAPTLRIQGPRIIEGMRGLLGNKDK